MAFDVGGNGEVIRDRETGFLLEDCDGDGVWRAVTHLMDHEAEREAMGRSARQFATTKFSIESRMAGLEAVYKGT